MNSQPPELPFGEPTAVQKQNKAAIGKGVLIGCGGCLVVLLGMAAVFAAIFFAVFAAIGNSDAVAEAIKRASASSQVQARLGTPLKRGWFTSGSVQTNNGASSADVNIPVSGPKMSGHIHAVGTRQPGGEWVFTLFEITIDGTTERINLLQPFTSASLRDNPFTLAAAQIARMPIP